MRTPLLPLALQVLCRLIPPPQLHLTQLLSLARRVLWIPWPLQHLHSCEMSAELYQAACHSRSCVLMHCGDVVMMGEQTFHQRFTP